MPQLHSIIDLPHNLIRQHLKPNLVLIITEFIRIKGTLPFLLRLFGGSPAFHPQIQEKGSVPFFQRDYEVPRDR